MVTHRRAALSCSRRSPRGRTSGLGAPREPRVRRCTGSAAGERGQRSALSILSLCYCCTRLELRAFVGSVDLVCPGLTAPGALPLAQRLRLPPGPTTVVAPVSTRAASGWRVQSAHLSHAFYVVPSSPTSIGSVGRRGAISGTSGAGSASWLGGGLANRVCPGSQDGASPLAQRWCAGRGMAGGEGSGAFLFPTLD